MGESRGIFVLCWPGVTMWGTASLSPPGTKTRLATDSQRSGGWGPLGVLHLHPHFLGWAQEDVLCTWLGAATASRSTHTSPVHRHTGGYHGPLARLRTPRSRDLPTVPLRHGMPRPASHTQPSPSKTRLSRTRVHGRVTTLPTARPQALLGREPGGPPFPGSWGQALVVVKHVVDKHCVAVARSCDSEPER